MTWSKYAHSRHAHDLAAQATTIGLLTSCESPNAKCVEVSAPIYSHQTIRLVVNADGNIVNRGQIEFPVHPSSWGMVEAYGIKDSAGNLLYQFKLPESVPLPAPFGYIIKDGELVIIL